MSTTTNRPPSSRVKRPAAMHIGLALTILATLAPVLDIATVDTISGHVRDAYPDWDPGSVAADRNAIVIYLVVTGLLGIFLWLLAIRAITTGRRSARAFATTGFAAGTLVALVNLTLGGEGYDVIVPYAYGVLTLLPCIAGVLVVVSVWRRTPTHSG